MAKQSATVGEGRPRRGTPPRPAEGPERPHTGRLPKIAIVGSPNVGKSALFHALSGKYVTVSNYPGTTVEVTRGTVRIEGREYELIDTPGMYSLCPITEEEQVGRQILLNERPEVVLHVVDAKNVERMLPMTLQLIEARLPAVLVLNIIDEAEKAGVRVDAEALARDLGVPAVATASTTGQGLTRLREVLAGSRPEAGGACRGPEYSARTEQAIGQVVAACGPHLGAAGISPRAAALLLLREDAGILRSLERQSGDAAARVKVLVGELKAALVEPIEYQIAVRLMQAAQEIASRAVREGPPERGFAETLGRLMMHPLTGFPFLLLVLYFGLYRFVGGFGAGTVVDFLDGVVFDRYLTPAVTRAIESIVPWRALQDLVVGEYGVFTLGIRYALALILPVVGFFFLVFAVIEDSGYLPRLAMLVDRTFKTIGLSGRAVIPMVLGLGCDTMATMVTRTLPTRRERVIATLLLALAVPCSAQLGVIMALLGGKPAAVTLWAAVIVGVFLLVGYLTARLLPGSRASFYIELAPLRVPRLSNVLMKTLVRVVWYLREILPLFLGVSVAIWLFRLAGVFDFLVAMLERPVRLVGLPAEAAKVFLLGFFRRDYGAAGLYDLAKHGLLNNVQLVVAAVALTLFLPCVAQFLMNVKERGWRTGLAISGFVLLFSFAVSYVLNWALNALGVTL